MNAVFHRYEDHGDVVVHEEYSVVKTTPCGVWLNVYGKNTFVLNGQGKRFAYSTDEAAKAGFFARKARQIRILESRLVAVKDAVKALKEGRIADYSSSNFIWD